MADYMKFPEKFDEFAKQYKIVDKEEVYTNGADLIPIFRVKQWLEERTDMNKKKSIICTAMLFVIVYTAIMASMYFKAFGDTTYFELLSPFIVGAFAGEKVRKFYFWLRRRYD